MTWRPNRRFRRDVLQIMDRGHSIGYRLDTSAGRHLFDIDGQPATFAEIAATAKGYREHPTMTESDLTAAMAEADELYAKLLPGFNAPTLTEDE